MRLWVQQAASHWRRPFIANAQRRPRPCGGCRASSRKRTRRSRSWSPITRRQSGNKIDIQHHPVRAAAPEDHLGDHLRRRARPDLRDAARGACRCRPGKTGWSTSPTWSRPRRRRCCRSRWPAPLLQQRRRRSAATTACRSRARWCRSTSGGPWSKRPASRMSDIPNTWDAFIDFFMPVQKKLQRTGHAAHLCHRLRGQHDRQRPDQHLPQFLIAYGGQDIVTPDGKFNGKRPADQGGGRQGAGPAQQRSTRKATSRRARSTGTTPTTTTPSTPSSA